MSLNPSSKGGRHGWMVVAAASVVLLLPSPVAAAEGPADVAVSRTAGAAMSRASAAAPSDPVQAPMAGVSAEPDYRVGHWRLRDVRPKQLRFGRGPAPPTGPQGPHDADGIPVRPLGPRGEAVYNPTVLAQDGLRYLHGYRKTGKWIYRRRANDIAKKLTEIARIRAVRWQPHKYDRLRKKKGWVNANSHGLVMSFYSRFYRLTGDASKLQAAASLLPAFHNRPRNARWLTMVGKTGHVWFEHWPDARPIHVWNAHMNALFGLYEYWRESKSPEAEQLLQGGIRTVRDNYSRFRRAGELSRYSLGSDWASVKYHQTHVAQLRVLRHITGDEWFARKADQLERDEAVWRRRVGRD